MAATLGAAGGQRGGPTAHPARYEGCDIGFRRLQAASLVECMGRGDGPVARRRRRRRRFSRDRLLLASHLWDGGAVAAACSGEALDAGKSSAHVTIADDWPAHVPMAHGIIAWIRESRERESDACDCCDAARGRGSIAGRRSSRRARPRRHQFLPTAGRPTECSERCSCARCAMRIHWWTDGQDWTVAGVVSFSLGLTYVIIVLSRAIRAMGLREFLLYLELLI